MEIFLYPTKTMGPSKLPHNKYPSKISDYEMIKLDDDIDIEADYNSKIRAKFFDNNQFIQLYIPDPDDGSIELTSHGVLVKKDGGQYHYEMHGGITDHDPLIINFDTNSYSQVTYGSGRPIISIYEGYIKPAYKSYNPQLKKIEGYTCIKCNYLSANNAKLPEGLIGVFNSPKFT